MRGTNDTQLLMLEHRAQGHLFRVARCFVIFRDPQVLPNQGVMVIEGACGMVLKRCFFFGSGEFVGYIPGRALRFPVRNVRNVTPCSLYFIAIAV